MDPSRCGVVSKRMHVHSTVSRHSVGPSL